MITSVRCWRLWERPWSTRSTHNGSQSGTPSHHMFATLNWLAALVLTVIIEADCNISEELHRCGNVILAINVS